MLVTGETTANVGGCAVGATVVGVGYTVDVFADPTTAAGVGLNSDVPAVVGRGLPDRLIIVVGVAVVVESADPTGAVVGIVEVRRVVGCLVASQQKTVQGGAWANCTLVLYAPSSLNR
jgi:hypothetical protein